jgi:uncharacterized membrane protein
MRRALPLAVVVLAILALADSALLTVEHFTSPDDDGQLLASACDIGGGECETVLASNASTILGIPNAVLGAGYYLALAVLATARLRTGRWPFPTLLPLLLLGGLAFSGYLMYTMVELAPSLCPYCIAAHAANTLIAIGYTLSRWVDTHRPVARQA